MKSFKQLVEQLKAPTTSPTKNDTIREQFFRGEICNVGDVVGYHGDIYEITARGTNHVTMRSPDGTS